MKRRVMRAVLGGLAALTITISALPRQVMAAGVTYAGAKNGAGVTMQSQGTAEMPMGMLGMMTAVATVQGAEDAWAQVEKESQNTEGVSQELDEFGCRLKSYHTCYKYEYAYRTGDTSGLEGEKEMAFYEGLKGYLDYAYQFDTPYEQEKAIHNHLVLNTKYAVDGYIDGKYSRDSWDYDGVFVHGQAVCQGYALSFKLCMDILGIESRVIYGNARNNKHAWNAVKLDGEWYYVDATWDDPLPDAEGKVKYDYFNVPEWWIAQEHEIKASLAPIGTKYSADDVLMVTVDSAEKELNKMLKSHWKDMSTEALYRVYVTKEDGTSWAKEDISNYWPKLSFLNEAAYKSMGWLDIEEGSAFCFCYQGRCGSPGKFVGMVLTAILIFASPVIAIVLIVLLVKKVRKWLRRKKNDGQGENDNLSV